MEAHLEALVHKHVRMAQHIARTIWAKAPHNLELDELISLAYLGLVSAAERWEAYCADHGYDPGRVEYFMPFAQRRMRGSIYDALRQADHVQRSVREKSKLLQEHGLGAGATEDELVKRTGLTKMEIRSTVGAVEARPGHIETTFETDLPVVDVESSVLEREVTQALAAAVADLSPMHQVVLALRYYSGMELRAVAVELGITESRASCIHTEAVLAVHAAMRAVAVDAS